MFKILITYFSLIWYSADTICCEKKMKFIEKNVDLRENDNGEWFISGYYVIKYQCKKCGTEHKVRRSII